MRRLEDGERVPGARLRERHADAEVRGAAGRALGGRPEQRDRVAWAEGRRHVAWNVIGRVAMADGDGDRLRMERRRDVRGKLDRTVGRRHPDHVAPGDAELRRRLRRDLHPRVPDGLRHRVRRFLEPGTTGAPPVVEPERRVGEEREPVRLAFELGRRHVRRSHARTHDDRRRLLPDAALAERRCPPVPDEGLPRRSKVPLEGRPGQRPLSLLAPEHGAADRKERVAHRP